MHRRHRNFLVVELLGWFLLGHSVVEAKSGGSSLMDAAGNLRVNTVSDSTTLEGGVLTYITSPGTPSSLVDSSDGVVLSLLEAGPPATLMCPGATLSSSSESDCVSLATSTLVANCIVVDGMTAGDIEAGLSESRHGVTLSTLFGATIAARGDDDDDNTDATKQTLVLPIRGADTLAEEAIVQQVESLFAAAVHASSSSSTTTKLSLGQFYDLKIVPYTDPQQIQSLLSTQESLTTTERTGPLSVALVQAHRTAKDLVSQNRFNVLPPLVSQGLLAVETVHSKLSRTVRARLASWNTRVARGLVLEGFGSDAEALLQSVLRKFDTDTIGVATLPAVAVRRMELRLQLQKLLEQGIQQAFEGQIANLETTCTKRLDVQMLKTVGQPAEAVMDANAAAIRNEALSFETTAAGLQVPSLGLTTAQAVRDMTAKLNDQVLSFPDSPAAKIQRMGKVQKAARKDKKPGQRAIDIGLDLVAVLRPDGFGSLQGFAGYQLGGNSLTFGIHNDADDPQVIAQFGGVRPPLLRVQPKLRFDVEL